MKKTLFVLLACMVAIAAVLSFSGCRQNAEGTDVWAEAIYTENAELGTGGKTVLVKVVAEEKTVTFTIHSDKETVGEALTEHALIEGEQGAYGLYVKKVNGITADYDVNGCYWGFYKNGESMMTGVDGTVFADGEQYELVYTKQ